MTGAEGAVLLPLAKSVPVLGISLIVAIVAGRVAHYFRIPQVTAYILVGVILGPTFLNFMSVEIANGFHLINEVAFGLILFNIGGEFHRGLLKRMTWIHVKYSALLALYVFLTVSAICLFFSLFTSLSFGQKLVVSSFLGIVAIAAAPPTTLMVIKEYEARGPLTQSIMVYLAVGTVIAIFGSHVATSIFQNIGVWQGGAGSFWSEVQMVTWSLLGSLLVGTVLGLALSFWEQRQRSDSEVVLAVICAILLGLAAAYFLNLEPLLISLFMGFALVNSSPGGRHVHAIVKDLGLTIYAIFFVLAGAHIHLQAQIKTLGILGIGYLIARTAGILISSRLAVKFTGEKPILGKYMGLSLLSHAGAALAIVIKLQGEADPSATTIVTVIMASIFFFELVGPVALQRCLVKAGETKGRKMVGRATSRSPLSVFTLLQDFMHNIGLFTPEDFDKLKSVKRLVDRKVLAISANAGITEILFFVENYNQQMYCVVDLNYKFKGLLSVSLFQDVIENPEKSKLVLAQQLIGSRHCLSEMATVDEALTTFKETRHGILPVIDEKKKRLVGTLMYKDLVLALGRRARKTKNVSQKKPNGSAPPAASKPNGSTAPKPNGSVAAPVSKPKPAPDPNGNASGTPATPTSEPAPSNDDSGQKK